MTLKEENKLDLKIIEILIKEKILPNYEIISSYKIANHMYPSHHNDISANHDYPYMISFEKLLEFDKWYEKTFSESADDYIIEKAEYIYHLAKHRNSYAKYFIKEIHSVFPYFDDDWMVLKTNFTIPIFHDIITIIKTIFLFILEHKDNYIEYLSICFTAEIICMTDYMEIHFNRFTPEDLKWVREQVSINGCVPIFCIYENNKIPSIIKKRINILDLIKFIEKDV